MIILGLFEPPVRTWEQSFRRRRTKYSGNPAEYFGTCDTSVRSFGNCCSRKQETMIPAVGNRNISTKNGYPVRTLFGQQRLTLFGDLLPALTHLTDPYTGEVIDAYIFIGVMTYSQYTYAEAFIDRSWITAHVHMYEFFGGVTPILVPDNAPTATNRKQSDRYEPVLIRSYEELAQHYNTAIIPARVRTPKDKPNAEGNVGHISTWITAALRNEQFFSLSELNETIREKLKNYNAARFEKKEGSRQSLFLKEEKPLFEPVDFSHLELIGNDHS